MTGKLYLPKSLPPDLATLKAVREAAKVAHNAMTPEVRHFITEVLRVR
jgi:hypothetical protein